LSADKKVREAITFTDAIIILTDFPQHNAKEKGVLIGVQGELSRRVNPIQTRKLIWETAVQFDFTYYTGAVTNHRWKISHLSTTPKTTNLQL